MLGNVQLNVMSAICSGGDEGRGPRERFARQGPEVLPSCTHDAPACARRRTPPVRRLRGAGGRPVRPVAAGGRGIGENGGMDE